MLFVNVQKPDALFRKIGECEGNVSYLDGQGARRDLKGVAAPAGHPGAGSAGRMPEGPAETDELHDGERMLKSVPPPRSSAVAAVFHARR